MNKVSYNPLISLDSKGAPSSIAVPIHHGNLDNLVGRLMQMCDLIGDVEQRTALKSTIKQISRDWLDGEYADAGYEKWSGPRPGVKPHHIPNKHDVELVISEQPITE